MVQRYIQKNKGRLGVPYYYFGRFAPTDVTY